MIEFTKSFKVGDKVFATLEEAQVQLLTAILPEEELETCQSIVKNKDRVIDTLTTTANSKPKARRINGGTKKRALKPVTNQPSEPLSTQPIS